jgi:hypothetical protein
MHSNIMERDSKSRKERNYNISNMFIIYQSHELYTQSFLCPQSKPGSEINYKISNMFITH